MNEFTKGVWKVHGDWGIKVDNVNNCIVTAAHFDQKPWWSLGNLHLIATAGTTATKLAESGYDAVKVLEVLPELVELVSHMDESLGAVNLLKQCRGE